MRYVRCDDEKSLVELLLEHQRVLQSSNKHKPQISWCTKEEWGKRNVNFRSTALAPKKCSYNTVATPLSQSIYARRLKGIRISISTLLLKYHVMQFLNQSLCKWDFMSKHLRTMVYFLRSWIFRVNGKWFILIWFFFMSQVRSFTLGQRAAMRAKTPRQQSNSLIWVALLFCGNTITISFQGESMKVRAIWSIWEISTKAW